MQREKQLTLEMRQAMGLPDESAVPAPFPEPELCPSRGGRSEAPPSPRLLVLYLSYAVVAKIRHIDIDFIVTVIIGFNHGYAVG